MKRPKKTRPRLPNYLRKLRYLQRIGALPMEVGVHRVHVYHDDWCRQYQGQPCNCTPDIRLAWTVPAGGRH